MEGRAFVPRTRKAGIAVQAVGRAVGELPRRLGSRVRPSVPRAEVGYGDVVL